MRRALLLSVVLALSVGGTVQARPWLTMHRARQALSHYGQTDVREGYATSYKVLPCHRHGPRVVSCDLFETGVDWAGDIGEMTWFDVQVRLANRRVTLRFP